MEVWFNKGTHAQLVGGFNPFEQYKSNWESSHSFHSQVATGKADSLAVW